jgi:hypothetical protein
MHPIPVCLLIAVLVALHPASSLGEDAKHPLTVQVMMGEMPLSNDNASPNEKDTDLFFFGAAGQKPYWGEMTQAGVEVGALFNWQSDTQAVAASGGGGGGSLAVAIDVNQFFMDYYFGGFFSVAPLKWVRAYAGAGPLLIFGWRQTEAVAPAATTSQMQSASGVSGGIYGRVGVDVIIADHFMIGVCARATQTELRLDDAAGTIDVEGIQYFGVFSYRF